MRQKLAKIFLKCVGHNISGLDRATHLADFEIPAKGDITVSQLLWPAALKEVVPKIDWNL